MSHDAVNNPKHYTAHPSGVECVTITEHMGFLLGNVIKYVWRADLKHDAIEDLEKAAWYLQREIAKRKKERTEAMTMYSAEIYANARSILENDLYIAGVGAPFARHSQD